MKINIILASFFIIISGCVSLHVDNAVDGYALFVQACDLHESLYCDSDGDAWKEMVTFRYHGGTISKTRTLQIIEEQQSVFNLIAKATAVDLWELPDNTTYSAASTFPHISSWLRINRVATAHSIQLFIEDKPQDTLVFLAPFNTTGQKLSKSGTLMHILVYIASRSMQYPVLASAIDELPDALLHEELGRAKTQYALIPRISECLLGEQHMAINTAKNLFADLHNQLKQDRMKMIQDLKKAGIDDNTLTQIENEELLSVSAWEKQVIMDLKRFQSFYMNALATRPSSELGEVDDEIEADIEKIGSDVEYEAAMAAWNLFMTNQVSGAFSMPDAKRLHSQVGRAISHQYLSMMMPSIGSFGIRYREFIASERLLLIRLAARVYAARHGTSPSTLQQLVDDKLLEMGMIIDPLSGKLFLIKISRPLEAYSVGRNLDDDNGVPWNRKTESGDTVLTPLREMWSVQQ